MKTQAPEGDFEVDSAQALEGLPPEVALATKLMKEICLNWFVRFTVDNRGRVLAVEVNEEAMQVWASMLPRWSEGLSKKGVTQMLKQMLPVLPEASLSAGDTWNDTLELNRPHGSVGFQTAQVEYRYAGPVQYKNTTVEKIVTEATLDGDGQELPQGLVVEVVSQENPGVIYFDNEAGRLVKIENMQKRTMEYSKDGRTAQEEVAVTSRIEVNPVP